MEGSSHCDHLSCDGESVVVTRCLEQMFLKSDLQPLNMDVPPTSNGEHSYVSSVKDGCESPLSSWDSEPETDISFVVNCDDGIYEGSLEGINLEEKYLEMEHDNQFVAVENNDCSLLWEMDNISYDELLKKLMEKEEELRVSNFKLQLSEQEILKLKVQVENSDGQLDNVREELKLKEDEVHRQKALSEEEIFKMKIQIQERENQLSNVHEELKLKEENLRKKSAELDTQIPHYVTKVVINMAEKLEVANKQLRISKDEIAILRKELDSKSCKTRELQDQLKVTQENSAKLECQVFSRRNRIGMVEHLVKRYDEAIRRSHELQVHRLNSEMLDLKAKFSLEKDETASLSEMNIQLTSKLENCESRNHELENKLRQYEAEKLKQEELHATQQMVLQDEISSLREEVCQRKLDVEAANKEFDKLTIERHEANAKIDKLHAEMFSTNDQISTLRRYISTSYKQTSP